jgi:predicted transposase/invertase (TIGR01784 family)
MAKENLIRFDWAIKRLLRNKADHVVLEGFLSVLLEEDIRIVNISESESNKEDSAGKLNRVDILVENSKNELIIIELQVTHEIDYFMRMLYGVSKAVTEYIKEGDRYGKIRKIYHINIVYFKVGSGEDYVYHGITEFRGIHCNDVLQLTKKQKAFFAKENVQDIYPEYYILNVRDFDDLAKDSLDEWIYYFKNNDILEGFTAQGLAEVQQRLQYDSLSEEEKKRYSSHLKQWRYEQNVIEDSFADGLSQGRAEGEHKKAIEIAKKLKMNGMLFMQISEITKLTIEEIENL